MKKRVGLNIVMLACSLLIAGEMVLAMLDLRINASGVFILSTPVMEVTRD